MHQISQSFRVSYDYPVVFTRSVFDPENETLRKVLLRAGHRRHQALVVLDSGVLAGDGSLIDRVRRYADRHRDLLEVVGSPIRVRGGEICKNDPREVGEILAQIERHEICRHSFILAIGGGSVLDAVGFAAATAHRGIRLIRMPTTVLAQNDAGIGVKNAVNFHGRKNFIGTFSPPFGVVNDFDLLRTLPARDMRSGIAEAIKVALIRDAGFFGRLREQRHRLAAFEREPIEAMIIRCAELHLAHIRSCGDPFELGSSRPLDFGHWSAHKLEELSRGEMRHGEAVAVGIAIDSLYSQRAGLLGESELYAIMATLQDLGFGLRPVVLRQLGVDRALADFREHLGGELSITLLDGIGRGVQVSEIDASVMNKCIDALLDVEDWSGSRREKHR